MCLQAIVLNFSCSSVKASIVHLKTCNLLTQLPHIPFLLTNP